MFIDIANKKKHNSPCYSASWTSVLNSACLAASHRWETPASHCNYKVPSFDRTNARIWSVYIVDLKMERNPHVSRWNPCRKFENYRFKVRRPPLHSLIAVANAGLSAPCGHSAIPRCKRLEGSPETAHTASCRLYCIPTQMLHVGSKYFGCPKNPNMHDMWNGFFLCCLIPQGNVTGNPIWIVEKRSCCSQISLKSTRWPLCSYNQWIYTLYVSYKWKVYNVNHM